MRKIGIITSLLAGVLALSGCVAGSPQPESEPTPTPSETPLTAEDIVGWVTDAEWSYAPQGVLEPSTLEIIDGKGADELSRTYEIGDAVEGDPNSDGVVDIAIPITQYDGNGVEVLWYVWLGLDSVEPGDPIAEQMTYPIARMSRCGNTIHEVSAIDGGFSIEETLRLADDPGDCATGGSGHQTREVTIIDVEGTAFPMLTAPIEAWGGVCPVPGIEWLDGIETTDVAVRAAPPETSPVVIEASERWAVYEVGEAPLLASGDVRFIGIQPESYWKHTSEKTDAMPVRAHCGFATASGASNEGTDSAAAENKAQDPESTEPTASTAPVTDDCPPPKSLMECYG
ncbi:MAG: hypothetical protein ACTHZ9_03215 [Leucobacter sp.]